MRYLLILLAAFVLSFGLLSSAQQGHSHNVQPSVVEDFDMGELAQLLAKKGLVGLVHGADPDRGLYVFTYSDANDFFKRINISVIAVSEADRATLKTLNRGDVVEVHGQFGPQQTPQPHIYLSNIKLLEKYDPGVATPAGHYQKVAKLPDDLKEKSEVTVLVHAVIAGGEVVVVEYKDAIVPLVVRDPALTEGLFRGDLIHVRYKLQGYPQAPTHLVLDTDTFGDKKPLQVLDRLVLKHNQQVVVQGRLVLFPKSNTINRDVWAVEERLPDGLARYFTLVNFTQSTDGSYELWDAIDKKLRAQWTANADKVFKGRNKFINLGTTIRVTGKATVFDPNQANAQIHLTADDIQFVTGN